MSAKGNLGGETFAKWGRKLVGVGGLSRKEGFWKYSMKGKQSYGRWKLLGSGRTSVGVGRRRVNRGMQICQSIMIY